VSSTIWGATLQRTRGVVYSRLAQHKNLDL
jgi:hypothetical protein